MMEWDFDLSFKGWDFAGGAQLCVRAKNWVVTQVRQLPMWEESIRAIYSIGPMRRVLIGK